jgi:hypothetical protein
MISNTEVDVISSPGEIDAIDLQDKYARETSDVEKATNMIYSTAGTPMVLFNAGAKNSSVGLKYSVQVDEAMMFSLLPQFETWFEVRLREISPKFPLAVKFLEITRLNAAEKFKEYVTGAQAGLPTKLAAMCALGFTQKDSDMLINLENHYLDLLVRMVPLLSAHTATGEEGGAPTKDTPLSDEGQKTKDANKNKSGS